MHQLCRYKVKWSELLQEQPDYVSVFLEAPYTITFDDVLTATRNIITSGGDDTILDEWYYPLYYFMFELNEILFENSPDDVELLEYLPNRNQLLKELFYDDFDEWEDSISEFAPEIIRVIEQFIANEKKPIPEHDYSDADKEHYIDMLDNDDRLKKRMNWN